MKKSILISIKPRFVADILNGKKTIELRKTMPKCELPIDVYIYCTKGTPRAILTDKGCVLANKLPVGGDSPYKSAYSLEGQVVAKFTLNKVEQQPIWPRYSDVPLNWQVEQKLDKLCLTKDEVYDYGGNDDDEYLACLWYIDNLEVFDDPKEFYEHCYKWTDKKIEWYTGFKPVRVLVSLRRPPQSWAYIGWEDEVEEDEA